jgi:hypothetical protein
VRSTPGTRSVGGHSYPSRVVYPHLVDESYFGECASSRSRARRDIWTQIYPIEHTGDRRRAIVPKWLLNAANQLNVAALPTGPPALLDRGPPLSPRRAPEDAAAISLCLPYKQAKAQGGLDWVSDTPARTVETDRPQHPIADRSRNSRAHVAYRKPNELATGSHRADNR